MAALRSGAGLLRVYVLEDVYPIVASSAPPEATIQPVESYEQPIEEPWTSGPSDPASVMPARSEILGLIERSPKPMVIDADGLNILSKQMDVLEGAAGPRLLTPHAGEMIRLAPGDQPSRVENCCSLLRPLPQRDDFVKGQPVDHWPA